MTTRSVIALFLTAACATPRTGPRLAVQWHQTDEPVPASSVFDGVRVRASYNEGQLLEARAAAAAQAGRAEEARTQLRKAAQAYRDFVERYPDTGWDLTIRYHAARLLADADRHDEAATLAERVADDPRASPKSRAMALLLATKARVDGRQLEALRIEYAQQRAGRPLQPRRAPPTWQRFVEATDAYLAGLDPEKPEPKDRVVTAAQLAVVAAQVEFATDHMDDARRRLVTILERWPGEPEVFRSAARLYVETFLVPGNPEGALAAATKVRNMAEAQARTAAPGQGRAAYAGAASDVLRIEVDLRFASAKALLENHPRAAAEEFEALALVPGADVAAARNGAAIAWDRAGEREKAIELRTRILEDHADSWVAPDAVLQLAAALAKRGDHAEAGRVYGEHVQRWPEDPNHCAALRNGAVELDLADRDEHSAGLYRAFGSDPSCANASPNVAAFALYRAGKQFLSANRPDDAREAFHAATRVSGVTNEDVKRRVAEASRLLRRLSGATGNKAGGR